MSERRNVCRWLFSGEKLTDDEVEQLIYEFEDKQGMVVYEDFIKAVLQR